jgi:hypothetical protein
MCKPGRGRKAKVMKWALGRAWIYWISRKVGMMFLKPRNELEKGKMPRSMQDSGIFQAAMSL